jgi:hypothetical protein
MIDIETDIPLGEAIRPSALAQSRVYRADARAILVSALVLAGAIVLSTIFRRLLAMLSLTLQPAASLLWIAGAFLGLIATLAFPRRIFADSEQENAFLYLAGEALTPEAKARSTLMR